jgi:hypothetical protein
MSPACTCLVKEKNAYIKHSVRPQIRRSDFHEALEAFEDLEVGVYVQAAARATFLAFDRSAEVGVVCGLTEQYFAAEFSRDPRHSVR